MRFCLLLLVCFSLALCALCPPASAGVLVTDSFGRVFEVQPIAGTNLGLCADGTTVTLPAQLAAPYATGQVFFPQGLFLNRFGNNFGSQFLGNELLFRRQFNGQTIQHPLGHFFFPRRIH